MKVTFALKESLYDCHIQIADSHGNRCYTILAMSDSDTLSPTITADVFDSDFSLTVSPAMPDVHPVIEDFECSTWKDRFAKKAVKMLVSTLDNAVLRVGCTYYIEHVQEGDRLDIYLQPYTFGTSFLAEAADALPIMYMFFEIFNFNTRYKMARAFATNRNDVLKLTKRLALSNFFGNGFLFGAITYPLQMAQIKHFIKDKKITKTLVRFNALSDEKRQRFLDKQERRFNR